jgi:hypothetical protein
MKNSFLSKLNLKLWSLLIALAGDVMLYFGASCVINLFNFFRLNDSTEALKVHLVIFEDKNEKFRVKASYTYLVDGKEFNKVEILSQPVYDNPYQTKKVLEETKTESWKVFYNKKNPLTASLQKEFSIKKIIDFILSAGLFFYFLFLSEVQWQNPFKTLLKTKK